MTEEHRGEELVVEITERLWHEFSAAVSKADVQATVLIARRDLHGRIVPEAVGEVLHRLAHYRLTCLRLTRA